MKSLKTGVRNGPIALLLACAMLVACGAIPYRTARNEPLCVDAAAATATAAAAEPGGTHGSDACPAGASNAPLPRHPVPRARAAFQETDGDVPPTFIGLALSGGGSRAANFSMAVMEQLDAIGVMRQVTAISSTSGGGLAGAYYALYGPDLDWRKAREAVAINFQDKWIVSVLLPHHLATTLFTHEDRSDLMADIFDGDLFRGATYADLAHFGPGHPIFLANATDFVDARRFPFSEDSFRDQLNSRLDTYPIAQAVVASAAFPGAFNSVTLRRYPDPGLPPSPGRPRAPLPPAYVQLFDGGPTDNLGVESLIQLAASHQRARAASLPAGAPQSGCLLMLADAYPSGAPGRLGWDPDPRSFIDHTIDTNFFDAFDAILARRRQDLLAYVGLGQPGMAGGGGGVGDVIAYIPLPGLQSVGLKPTDQVVQFDVPTALSGVGHPWALIRPVLRQTAHTPAEALAMVQHGIQPAPVAEGYFRCTAWHLDLGNLMQIKPYKGTAGQTPQRLTNDTAGLSDPMLQHRARLNLVVNQIATGFKLKGPGNCSAKLLEQALYAAAFVAVREDHDSRTRICNWLQQQGVPVDPACRAFPGNMAMDVKLDLVAAGETQGDRALDSVVACSVDQP